ncbi:hypothetical protein OsJ_20373 [Oryza sativa Japonica Group]|uniref:Uncharacterized protein n=1 Tax=Oryza sativa subsp. japonica TaxID=39947 RepID=B9FRW3_ORYSJ|nr:hypothetical protein OsJ_20373 [Oryza sativa Japonica Group]
MAVEIVKSSMVTAGEATPEHRIWLSNLDLLVARSHTPTVYVYRRTGPDSDAAFFSPDVLKAALSKVLVPFYPLAGRLAQDSAGRPEISCTGEGVLFVTARSGATIDDLGDLAPSDELRRMLVPAADVAAASILAMFQVTFFRCGGVCLGAAIHHTAADGLAALDFVNTWAAIARDVAGDGEAAAAAGAAAVARPHAPPRALPSRRALRPRRNQLNALKGAGAGAGKRLSTFTAVVAHVWRCACKARGLAVAGTEAATRLYMTADARTRLHPPLPRGYLGNAIFRASAVSKVSDIVAAGPLGAVAEKVSAATARLDDGYVRSLLDHLEQTAAAASGGAAGLRKGEWVMPESDLWVISWQGLPLYDADFGWGRPAFMGRACLQFSGLVYLVPGRDDGDGRLDVVVAMDPESLAKFKDVFYEELKC